MARIRVTKRFFQPKVLVLKSRARTYVLLTAVIIIWGAIALKIINGLNPEREKVEIAENAATKLPTAVDNGQRFSIKEAKRDPFLDKPTEPKTTVRRKKANTSKNNPFQSEMIEYKGIIQNQETKDRVFIINVNQEQYLMKQNQTLRGIKLVNGSKDNITLFYKGFKKSFKLN